jgi:FixJ family two-component response regulator
VQKKPMILIVNDKELGCEGTMDLIKATEAFEHADGFLKSIRLRDTSYLVTDMKAPGMAEFKRHRHLVGSNMRVAPKVQASCSTGLAGRKRKGINV